MRCGKALSVAISVILAVSLCPMPAFAAPLEAGSADTSAVKAQSTSLKTQVKKKAKKKYVWLVDKISAKHENEGTVYHSDTRKCTYSKGLLTKLKSSWGSGSQTYKYSYKNNVLSKVAVSSAAKITFTLKKGERTKGEIAWTGSVPKILEEYTYKNGNVSKVKATEWYMNFAKNKAEKQKPYTVTYTRNKSGLCTKQKSTKSKNNTFTYSYDKHKNLKGMKSGYEDIAYENTYDKNGCLTKSVAIPKNGSSTETRIITYKKVKVDSGLVKTIQAQQWALLNGNTNFALSGYNFP